MRTTARFNMFEQGFSRITGEVEALAVESLEAAAAAAGAAAQANASIDLKIEVVPAHPVADGYSAGIKSRKTTSTPGKSTPIARFFDDGTLGHRKLPLKQPRKGSWTVKRKTGAHVAHRGDIDGKGIPAEGFFAKARVAGRAEMLQRIREK